MKLPTQLKKTPSCCITNKERKQMRLLDSNARNNRKSNSAQLNSNHKANSC